MQTDKKTKRKPSPALIENAQRLKEGKRPLTRAEREKRDNQGDKPKSKLKVKRS